MGKSGLPRCSPASTCCPPPTVTACSLSVPAAALRAPSVTPGVVLYRCRPGPGVCGWKLDQAPTGLGTGLPQLSGATAFPGPGTGRDQVTRHLDSDLQLACKCPLQRWKVEGAGLKWPLWHCPVAHPVLL